MAEFKQLLVRLRENQRKVVGLECSYPYHLQRAWCLEDASELLAE